MKLYEYDGNLEVISGSFFLLINASRTAEVMINCHPLNGVVDCSIYSNNDLQDYTSCSIKHILNSQIITNIRDFCSDNDKVINDFLKWVEKYASMV